MNEELPAAEIVLQLLVLGGDIAIIA